MSATARVFSAQRGLRTRATQAGVALTAAATMVLSACGTVPGTSVNVDGTSFSEQTVTQRTAELISENLSDENAAALGAETTAMLNRYQATDLIRHQLTQKAAKAQGFSVTDADVNAFITNPQYGGADSIAKSFNVPVSDIHASVYDYLVLGHLAAAIPDDGVQVTNVTVTVDAVTAADRSEAVADRAAYLKDPSLLDEDAAAATASGQVPSGEFSLLKGAADATVGLYTAPEGDIVLVPQQGTYLVARITSRVEEPATLTKDMVASAQTMVGLQAQTGYMALASLLLRDYTVNADISVNPRFGQWDPKTVMVIPPNDGL